MANESMNMVSIMAISSMVCAKDTENAAIRMGEYMKATGKQMSNMVKANTNFLMVQYTKENSNITCNMD